MTTPLLQVRGLVREFGHGPGLVRAVDDVSFDVMPGEALGLVGESGSGKSTTARCVLRLIEPTAGEVRLDGQDMLALKGPALRRLRSTAQLVFQDPYSSLNPRMTVADIIAEGIRIHRPRESSSTVQDEVVELLELVGLRPDHLTRKPAAFSGGERQRIGIARALALKPKLLVCDEPVASLDVSIQAQILNLFAELMDRLDLTLVYIAHDLSTVRHLCGRIAVMQDGTIREIGTREQIYEDPQHEYTRALMAAVPEPDPRSERAKLTARRSAQPTGASRP
ncbi:ATP-binding cassette domain-containing protein [Serinicoccus kebangsaanensis]|uniref:ATP-binding cassette domain-containing protein n=1 Tax=Serinicoccus kebangsaanensis TaxID=2602069 RepID=UPI00124C4EA1|nr:ATP-binding cassette domain-containing protein [Serinicoccus kebangsaanensis]